MLSVMGYSSFDNINSSIGLRHLAQISMIIVSRALLDSIVTNTYPKVRFFNSTKLLCINLHSGLQSLRGGAVYPQ